MPGTDLSLREQIRNRIIGEMHLGHLRARDRLPSIRALAQELGVDHRAVAAVLRDLARDGLVEIRRTGVVLARQERLGDGLVSETASWLASVLGEARRRRIVITDFPDFVRSCISRRRLRCACVESNEDASASICMELREEFGLEAVAVPAEAVSGRGHPSSAPVPESLASADLVVSTAFHAGPVRQYAATAGKPFALITMPEEMSRIIERKIQSGGLTVIVSDPLYRDRFHAIFGASRDGALRVLLADDRQAISRLSPAEPVLATRAARHRLPDLDVPLLLPRFPSISPEATREIAEIVIRLNIEDTSPQEEDL